MRNSHDDKPKPHERHARWTSTKHTAHHAEHGDAEGYSKQPVDLVPDPMGRVVGRGKTTDKGIGGFREGWALQQLLCASVLLRRSFTSLDRMSPISIQKHCKDDANMQLAVTGKYGTRYEQTEFP